MRTHAVADAVDASTTGPSRQRAASRHAQDLYREPAIALAPTSRVEFGCVSGIRPGEIDALPWENIRWDEHEIDVRVQWSAKLREFDIPKYRPYNVALTARAREVARGLRAARL